MRNDTAGEKADEFPALCAPPGLDLAPVSVQGLVGVLTEWG